MMRSGIYEALAYLKYRKPGPAIQDEVIIGIPLAITGIHAKFGEQHHNGYKLALEEILAEGGICSPE